MLVIGNIKKILMLCFTVINLDYEINIYIFLITT